jgi:hypothetical protein
MRSDVLLILGKLVLVLGASLGVMMAFVLVVSIIWKRNYRVMLKAVVFLWLAFVGALATAITLAVFIADDFSDRLTVFALAFVGLFAPFVLWSKSMKCLK